LLMISAATEAQIKSAKSGAWGADTTWVGGIVPGANDDVLIDTSNTVTVNIANAVCKNLTVKGTVTFPDVNALGITVNGDLLVEATGKFNTYSSGSPLGIRYQTIELKKNLTVLAGGSFDMRRGSGATVGVGRVVFSGTENSIISLSQTIYGSSVEEFNSVVINKTGAAKVVLASGNLYQNNNSTNAPDTLVLINGVIETGTNTWVHLATGGTSIQGASQNSYIYGKVGRGITNSGGNASREFPIGSATKYRPLTVRVAGPANATGHYVWAQLKEANANTGSSAFTGGIDKVSAIRHYEVGYLQNAGTAAAMPSYGFIMSYTNDDGVNAGNMDLRVAYSKDGRATWNGVGPVNDTTKFINAYSTTPSDSIAPHISIGTGTSIFVALARATGTTTNPLEVAAKKAQFAMQPKAKAFGTVKVGETKFDSVYVLNIGDDTLRISDISSTTGDFVSTENTLTIAPGATVVLKVFFEPQSTGAKNAFIIFTHNGPTAKDTLTVSGTGDPAVSVRPEGYVPSAFMVHQNYPNPFNPETAIAFELPARAAVTVEVFTLLGNSVALLQNGMMNAGVHTVRWNADSRPSGIYFYRVTAGSTTITKRMMLLK
ncbi:MAG: T9SS type A sorting domain-containing protein, partial [Bacteroidetes bacterium]|nr:T9SS type A sorting domain-containing protein [Bacteroidota bacterium]